MFPGFEALGGNDPTGAASTAVISADGKYRYRLTRTWDPDRPPITWIMLNPSIADAERDDHTIRCCRRFATREGAGGIVVVNLYPYRATTPSVLGKLTRWERTGDPLGLDAISSAIASARAPVIVAWGTRSGTRIGRGEYRARASAVAGAAEAIDVPLWCLGTTSDGSPRHPSRLGVDVPLTRWTHA